MLSDDVVAYSDSGWSKIGKLRGYNFLMTPITVDGDIYVFGGSGDMTSFQKKTEIWRVISIICINCSSPYEFLATRQIFT